MRKPRSRWRKRARAWKRRGHLSLRPWSGDSGALLVCGFVLEPLGRTPRFLRGGWQHGPLLEARRTSALEAARILSCRRSRRRDCRRCRRGYDLGVRPTQVAGGRSQATPNKHAVTWPACGGCTARGMQWCRQRAGGVRWVWRRQRRIVGVPWPTPAAGLLGSLGLSMGSARVAARPSTLARL